MPEMKLLPNQLKEAAYQRTVFSATPAVGTTKEDILNNEYWTHVARKVQPGSLIEVTPEDLSFYALLIVTWVGHFDLRVKLLNYVELTEENGELAQGADYTPVWRQGRKWCVLRVKDNAIIAENLPTKKEALVWIADRETSQMTGQ